MTTIKIGRIELNGELKSMALDELVEDVPVNERHVRELASSMEKVGQISPVVVWATGKRVIDGFHRIAALKLAKKDEVLCLLYSCDEETFWNLRILNAVTHRTVSFARIVTWVRNAFSNTRWAKMMGVEEAFRTGKKGAGIRLPLVPNERAELTEWVQEKSQLWNLSPQRVAKMLRIAHAADPSLVAEVRDETAPGTITQSTLAVIGRKIRDFNLQQTLVLKIRSEKLTLKEVQDLLEELTRATTQSLRQKILLTPFRRTTRGRPQKHAILELRRIHEGIVADALVELIEYMPKVQSPQHFDDAVADAFATIARYLGHEDATALEILQRENRVLHGDVDRLSEDLKQKSEDLAMQRRRVRELEEALTRSR